MSISAQLFVANHHDAVAYAAALDSGHSAKAPQVSTDVPTLTDLDLEVLGEHAVKTVHATGTECELAMVDIELDSLLEVPAGLVAVFAELKDLEDQEDVTQLAADWAATEEMSSSVEETEPLVRMISELASAAQQGDGLGLYFYSA